MPTRFGSPGQDSDKDRKSDKPEKPDKPEKGGGFNLGNLGNLGNLFKRNKGDKDKAGDKDGPARLSSPPPKKPDDGKKDKGGGGGVFSRFLGRKGDAQKDSGKASPAASGKPGATPAKGGDAGKPGGIAGVFARLRPSGKGADSDKDRDKGAPGGPSGTGLPSLSDRSGASGGMGARSGTPPLSDRAGMASARPGTAPLGNKASDRGDKGSAKGAAKTGEKRGILGRLFRRGGDKGAALVSQPAVGAPPKGAKGAAAVPPARLDRQAKPIDYSHTQVNVKHHGLSLDQKLDLVGYALMFAALVIFFGLIQPDEGTFTKAIVDVLGGFFGYARFAIPIPLLVVGGWLLIRHFKENPFIELDMLRIVGLALLFLTFVTTLHFFEMLEKVVDTWDELAQVSAAAVDLQRGGGWVGDRLYYILIRVTGEWGIAAVLIAMWVIAIMLAFEITLAEISTYLKSVFGWFGHRRAAFIEGRQMWRERRAAQREARAKARAEKEAARAAKAAARAAAVKIEKPSAPAIPAAATLAGHTAPGPAAIGTAEERKGFPAALNHAPGAPADTSAAPPVEPVPVAGPARLGPAAAKASILGTRSAPRPVAPKVSADTEDEAEDGAAAKEEAPVPTPVAQPAPTPLGSRTASTPAPASVRAATLRHGDAEDADAEDEEDKEAAPAPVARSTLPLGLRDRTEDRGKAVEPAKPGLGVRAGASPTDSAPVTSAQPDEDSRPDSNKDVAPKPAALAAARPGISGTARPAAAPGPFGPFGKASVSVAADKPDDADAESDDEAGHDSPSAHASATKAPFFGAKPAGRPVDFGSKPTGKPAAPVGRKAGADEDDEIDDLDDVEDEALDARPEAGASALRPSRFGAAPAAGVSTQGRPSPATGPANEPVLEPSKPTAGREESAPAPRLPSFGARPGASPSASRPGLSGPFARTSEPNPVAPAKGHSDKDDSGAADAEDSPSPLDLKPPTPKPGLFGNRPPTPSAFAPAKPAPKPGTASQAPTRDSSGQSDDDDEGTDGDDLRYEPLEDEAPDTPASANPAPASPAPASPARPGLFASLSAPLKTNPGPAADKPSPAVPAPAPSAPVLPPDPDPSPGTIAREHDGWHLPQIHNVLEAGSQQIIQEETLRERARIIEETLESFGAPGKVIVTNPGPVITQFGVEPGYLSSRQGKQTRVKVSAIAKLDADLALALSARSIRIEAPVPGKSYVGIEVPNAETALVGLRDIMESPAFDREKYRLPIALGKSIDGAPIVADLTQMPHLLIAGTTGSGKSVCVNAIISCLLLEYAPSELQLIMVDPKRVELTGYNGIPHLVSPVVVDLERIVGVLKWVTREMEDRYKRFSAIGARNIIDHNARIDGTGKRMPYLVVIVDELADLMMLAPDETEKVLTRLAQMARATGIHLIISTQRPSVDVVTGLIKANFPARISFAVASSVDSRVVLDQPGAEKLLGRGDMLYQAPDAAAPIRMQGVFVSDAEINRITRHWKEEAMNRREARPAQQLSVSSFDAMERPAGRPSLGASQAPKPDPARLGSIAVSGSPSRSGERSFFDAIRPSEQSEDDVPAGDDDDLYREAVDLFKSMGKVSISLLQRRLRIGVNRAARLIDLMKQRGVLGSVDTDDDDEAPDPAEAEA